LKISPPRFSPAPVDGNGSSSDTRPPYLRLGQYVDDISLEKNRNSSPPEISYHRHWRDCKCGSMWQIEALKNSP